MGHDVTVYALLGKKTDYSIYEDKYGLKVRNLGHSYLKCSNSDGAPQPLWSRVLSRCFERWFQYPHIELKWLVGHSLKKQENIDLLITVASPHTIHWGAAQTVSRKIATCWVADCGDPFMGNPFQKHPRYFEKYEREWCEKADAITIPIEEGKNAYFPEYRHKIHTIPQAFDSSETVLAEYKKNIIPTFAFSGTAYRNLRDPEKFMNYLCELDYDFKFVVYTRYRKLFEPTASRLGHRMEFRDYIPRRELLFELSKMDFLINIRNGGNVQLPSKLIDYGQTKRPILNITSEFTEEEKKSYNNFIRGDYSQKFVIDHLEQYDIRNVCEQFLNLHKKVTEISSR